MPTRMATAATIPDAVSAPTTGNLGPGGHFLDPAALRARFAGLGVPAAPAGTPAGDAPADGVLAGEVAADGAVTTGVYCGSGVTAADCFGVAAALPL